ncbi:hypothetical protein, partial [Gallibacterium anatis]|uniref:hypothetical protein n=1 Tax=Gallibacterium anatis TaxID=750 RepID=UPI00058036BE
ALYPRPKGRGFTARLDKNSLHLIVVLTIIISSSEGLDTRNPSLWQLGQLGVRMMKSVQIIIILLVLMLVSLPAY